jgi:hypothetical protein
MEDITLITRSGLKLEKCFIKENPGKKFGIATFWVNSNWVNYWTYDYDGKDESLFIDWGDRPSDQMPPIPTDNSNRVTDNFIEPPERGRAEGSRAPGQR